MKIISLSHEPQCQILECITLEGYNLNTMDYNVMQKSGAEAFPRPSGRCCGTKSTRSTSSSRVVDCVRDIGYDSITKNDYLYKLGVRVLEQMQMEYLEAYMTYMEKKNIFYRAVAAKRSNEGSTSTTTKYYVPLKRRMDSLRQSDNQIGLNVGGKIYLTTRDTLTRYPNSFFAIMLDSDIPSDRDAQGNYLIDRINGKIFRHVLNFMRCGELVLPRGFNEFDLLEREADFFSLEALEVALREATGKSVAGMSVGVAVGTGAHKEHVVYDDQRGVDERKRILLHRHVGWREAISKRHPR